MFLFSSRPTMPQQYNVTKAIGPRYHHVYPLNAMDIVRSRCHEPGSPMTPRLP